MPINKNVCCKFRIYYEDRIFCFERPHPSTLPDRLGRHLSVVKYWKDYQYYPFENIYQIMRDDSWTFTGVKLREKRWEKAPNEKCCQWEIIHLGEPITLSEEEKKFVLLCNRVLGLGLTEEEYLKMSETDKQGLYDRIIGL